MSISICRICSICAATLLLCAPIALAHNVTRDQAIAELDTAQNHPLNSAGACCNVSISLISASTQQPIKGTFRITNHETDERWWPEDWTQSPELRRVEDWWTIDGVTTITLPPGDYSIEAMAGLNTLVAHQDVTVSDNAESVTLPIQSFHLAGMEHW